MKILNLFIFLFFTFTLSAQDYSKSLITTTGEAIVYAAPDEIRMTLGINATATNISETKAENNRISSETIKYLKAQGVAPRHIQTQYLRVSKLHRPVMHEKEMHTFGANQTIHICIKDLGKYTSIVDGLLGIGVTSISSPQFRNTNIAVYKDEARAKAIKNAQRKAVLMTESLNQSIKHAFQIKEIDLGWSRNNQGTYATGTNNEKIEPEELEVTAKVEVSFILLNE